MSECVPCLLHKKNPNKPKQTLFLLVLFSVSLCNIYFAEVTHVSPSLPPCSLLLLPVPPAASRLPVILSLQAHTNTQNTHTLPPSHFIFSYSHTDTLVCLCVRLCPCTCFFSLFHFLSSALSASLSLARTHAHARRQAEALVRTPTRACEAQRSLHLLFHFFSLPHFFPITPLYSRTPLQAHTDTHVSAPTPPPPQFHSLPSTNSQSLLEDSAVPLYSLSPPFIVSSSSSSPRLPFYTLTHAPEPHHTGAPVLPPHPAGLWTALFLWPLWAIWSAMSLLRWSPASLPGFVQRLRAQLVRAKALLRVCECMCVCVQ